MSTLHVFGCSFTAPYTTNGRVEYRQYYTYRNNTFPNDWSTLLSNKLGVKLRNYGISGASNYEIFGEYCKNINNFKSNDIVIIGWTFKERFRLYNQATDEFAKVAPKFRPKLADVSNSTIDEILANRNNHIWVSEVILWEHLIKKTLEMCGVKLLTWSFDKSFPKEIFIKDELFKLGAESIEMETCGDVNDNHMGEIGHLIQSEYIYDMLNKNQINIL